MRHKFLADLLNQTIQGVEKESSNFKNEKDIKELALQYKRALNKDEEEERRNDPQYVEDKKF